MSKKCPICQKPAVEAFFPFCSKTCSLVDLGRWFKGAYVIPGDETAADALPEYFPDAEDIDDRDPDTHRPQHPPK